MELSEIKKKDGMNIPHIVYEPWRVSRRQDFRRCKKQI